MQDAGTGDREGRPYNPSVTGDAVLPPIAQGRLGRAGKSAAHSVRRDGVILPYGGIRTVPEIRRADDMRPYGCSANPPLCPSAANVRLTNKHISYKMNIHCYMQLHRK